MAINQNSSYHMDDIYVLCVCSLDEWDVHPEFQKTQINIVFVCDIKSQMYLGVPPFHAILYEAHNV